MTALLAQSGLPVTLPLIAFLLLVVVGDALRRRQAKQRRSGIQRGPGDLAKARAALTRIWWTANGITAPHPLDPMVHMNTATAACMNGRHRNCSGYACSLFPPRRGACSCPHHRGERR